MGSRSSFGYLVYCSELAFSGLGEPVKRVKTLIYRDVLHAKNRRGDSGQITGLRIRTTIVFHPAAHCPKVKRLAGLDVHFEDCPDCDSAAMVIFNVAHADLFSLSA